MVIILPLCRGCFHLGNTRIPTLDLKKLFTEERAVSPVIGVILMVAITVILAAVIGAFVLGLGGSTDETPQASLSFDGDANEGEIEHRGGASLDNENLVLRGSAVGDEAEWPGTDTFSAGSSQDISGELDGTGGTLRVVWTGGSDDAVLGSFDVGE